MAEQIPLGEALICINCNTLFRIPAVHCPHCASESFVPLDGWLNPRPRIVHRIAWNPPRANLLRLRLCPRQGATMTAKEYITRDGKIAYVRENPAFGGMYTFYARPAARPDLCGHRVKFRGEQQPIFNDLHEAREALAAYAKKRGWKAVAHAD